MLTYVFLQAHTLLKTHVSEQLRTLQNDLVTRTHRNFEAECLINALLEELEEMADDVEDARSRQTLNGSSSERDANALLDKEMITTLKRLQGQLLTRPFHKRRADVLQICDQRLSRH